MAEGALRLDKWLWFVRLAPTRPAAQALCEAGRIRLDGRVVDRAHQVVRIGQVLTLPRPGGGVRVVRVMAFPPRRGPFAQVRTAYDDLLADPPLTEQPATD